MTVNANPYIVTTGLTMNLDAGNPRSYPGTGTVWTDVSGQGYIGTLNNGVSYSSGNGGILNFDGVDDRVLLNSNTIISGTQNFTIETAVNSTAANTAEYIFGNYGAGNNGLELYFYQNKIYFYWTNGYHTSTATVASNTWYWITVTRNGNTSSIYINGSLDSTGTNASSIPTSNPYTIGNGYDYSSEIFVGKIAIVRCYNVALTADQITQNFNAYRGRYGI